MKKRGSKPEISVVIPVLNEEENILGVLEEVGAALKDRRYEIVVVDDGSFDNTPELVRKKALEDRRIKFVRFSENIGKSFALTLGFKKSVGEVVVSMDGDGQFDPREIGQFIERIEGGSDFVNGYIRRKHWGESWLKSITTLIFNKVSNLVFGLKLHDANCGFKAMRGSIARKLSLGGGEHRYLPYIVNQLGFSVSEVPVKIKGRGGGRSKYGPLMTLMDGFFDLIKIKIRYSRTSHPLAVFSVVGIVFIVVGLIMGVQILVWNIDGWVQYAVPYVILDSLILSLGFLSLMLGFIMDDLQDIKKNVALARVLEDEDTNP